MSGRRTRPDLILTTKGRKSGEERLNALIYGMAGENPMIVASKGGNPQHPAWYLNLREDPNVQVQIRGDKFDAVARDATPRGAPRAVEADGAGVARLRQLPEEDRSRDPDRDPRARRLIRRGGLAAAPPAAVSRPASRAGSRASR